MTATPLLPIVAIITVKNEERNIAETILSAQRLFRQVVVVDSQSTDRTPEICVQLGVEYISFAWDGRYPKKKQWCLENVHLQDRWVLFLDGDEQVTPALCEELIGVFTSDEVTGVAAVQVPIEYHFGGRKLRYGYVPRKTVLLNREHCRFPDVGDIAAPGMGELEGHYQPEVRGHLLHLSGELRHNDLDGVGTWIDRHCRYADWEAYVRNHPEIRMRISNLKTAQGRLFDRLPGKSVAFFLYCYIAKRGFQDGRAGLDYALGLSFYRWQISVKARELRRIADNEQ